jgi:two-component system chemotaxis sensor kinase CheA
VLGEGDLVPILHVADLMRSAQAGSFASAQARPPVPDESPRKSVLVAEDSITSRMLLQNILEAAGYRVQTAVDGFDAFSRLKAEGFDAVVSDVEMPRMNGFDLTEKVRADKALADTPVVLVTALDSQRDRERGVDVGADAYIVKSSFDQSDLLQTLERLL